MWALDEVPQRLNCQAVGQFHTAMNQTAPLRLTGSLHIQHAWQGGGGGGGGGGVLDLPGKDKL